MNINTIVTDHHINSVTSTIHLAADLTAGIASNLPPIKKKTPL